MTIDPVSDIDQWYLGAWTEPDAGRRRADIERLWSGDGRSVISPLGVPLYGVDDIAMRSMGVG